MACGHVGHEGCNKSLNSSIAGSDELARAMLKTWVMEGYSVLTKEEHKDEPAGDRQRTPRRDPALETAPVGNIVGFKGHPLSARCATPKARSAGVFIFRVSVSVAGRGRAAVILRCRFRRDRWR